MNNNYELTTVKNYIKKRFEDSDDIKKTEKELIKEFSDIISEIENKVEEKRKEREKKKKTDEEFYNNVAAVLSNPKYKNLITFNTLDFKNEYSSSFEELINEIFNFPRRK